QTGVIAWTPTQDQVGDHVIIVTASDPDGGIGSQTFTIQVRANEAPLITSTPPAGVAAGATYRYDVRATDPEGGRLSYALTGPVGMTIDDVGRLRWATTPADIGTYPVRVTVSDEFGLTTTDDFSVAVTADTEAPRVDVVATVGTVDVGAVVLLRV